ncbi:MAG: class I SAM-dependent methyltransferase [Syntrophobacterales bacterium]|nr:class I SAM-dependent methyltransferase [Syntrophobacterales bacterium]
MKEALNAQQRHWDKTFSETADMFGAKASEPAQDTAELLKKEGKQRILELGGGQGRDTLFFAGNGFHVDVLDYSEAGVNAIMDKAAQSGLSALVFAQSHDVRKPLPFADETFDACYSHMLYCMALTTSELEALSGEVLRVLRPNGLHVYTVRNTNDFHYGKGIHRGEDLYEVGGFTVHFFSMQKVEQLAKGYELLNVTEFEEGALPRKLFRVTLRKG